MAKADRPVIKLEDDEGNFIHLTWGRSGRRIIVTVCGRGGWNDGRQCTLAPEQGAQLAAFIEAGSAV